MIGAGVVALLLVTLPVAVPIEPKKSSPAATADAATSEVLASVLIEEVRAALRLAAVAVGRGADGESCRPAADWRSKPSVESTAVVPSGKLKVKLT